MQLRDHPLLHYFGVRSWPPRWMSLSAPALLLKGEIGVLADVVACKRVPGIRQSPRLHLFMIEGGKRYIATVLISDATFCAQIGELLKSHYGRTLEEIGGLDLSHHLL